MGRRTRAPEFATVTAVILLIAAAAYARPARAAPAAIIAGRITFRDATREVKAAEVERLRWGHLTIEMRRGWEVYAARPDANGLFTITGPPGTYQLEYVRVGQLAEFLVPHEVRAGAGRLTCLGTLEIDVRDMTQDLGNNTSSQLHLRDDCATLEPELRRLGGVADATDATITTALPKPVARGWKGPTAMEVLVGFRAEADIQEGTAVRGAFVLPISEDRGWGNFLASASVVHLSAGALNKLRPTNIVVTGPPPQPAWGGTIGAGYSVWLLEASAFGGYLSGSGNDPHGPLGGVSLRLGSFLFGIGVRAERYSSGHGQIAWLTLDLSPVGLLGSLL